MSKCTLGNRSFNSESITVANSKLLGHYRLLLLFLFTVGSFPSLWPYLSFELPLLKQLFSLALYPNISQTLVNTETADIISSTRYKPTNHGVKCCQSKPGGSVKRVSNHGRAGRGTVVNQS